MHVFGYDWLCICVSNMFPSASAALFLFILLSRLSVVCNTGRLAGIPDGQWYSGGRFFFVCLVCCCCFCLLTATLTNMALLIFIHIASSVFGCTSTKFNHKKKVFSFSRILLLSTKLKCPFLKQFFTAVECFCARMCLNTCTPPEDSKQSA